MPQRTLIVIAAILIALFGAVISVVAAPIRFSGLLELRYAEHTASEAGVKVLDAGHFAQKYSLIAEKKGSLQRGRLGKYDLALGYEWSSVDAYKGDRVKVDIDNPLDKILYRGDVTIAPGGLPFNLHLYSYDMQTTAFGLEDLSEIFTLPNKGERDWTITSVFNGTAKTTGATLTAGTQNGHYKGKYRDLLATMPRLLIDYRQVDVRDVKGPFKRDYVDRDLAFVSLNKKNNWFHYRIFTHKDRLDPTQDYREQTYLLGTINHRNQREWINLTNWIQVSADIAYSETTPNASITVQKRYDMNLFTLARRTRWNATNFTSFSRMRDDNRLEKQISVPFYANGELNRDTSWRFRFVGNRYSSDLISGGHVERDNLYVSARVDTFRQSRYIMVPTIDAEMKNGSQGEGNAVRAGVEFFSNTAYRSPYSLLGTFTIARFSGTGISGRDVDFWEQNFHGKVEKDLTSRLRAGIEEELSYGSGSYENSVTDTLVASSNALVGTKNLIDGGVFRNITTLYAEYRATNKINNRLELSYDYLSTNGQSGSQLVTSHRLEYSGRELSLTVNNQLLLGDSMPNVGLANFGSSGLSNNLNNTAVGSSFITTTNGNYAPSRAVTARLQFEYEWRDLVNATTDERIRFLQTYRYGFWKTSGVMRKLAQIGQELEYEDFSSEQASATGGWGAFTLFGDYYPTRRTLLGAKLRFDRRLSEKTDAVVLFLTAGVNFNKFKVNLDYSYGDRTAGRDAVSYPDRKEQRWEIRVAKTF